MLAIIKQASIRLSQLDLNAVQLAGHQDNVVGSVPSSASSQSSSVFSISSSSSGQSSASDAAGTEKSKSKQSMGFDQVVKYSVLGIAPVCVDRNKPVQLYAGEHVRLK